jgi:hypothetical protein
MKPVIEQQTITNLPTTIVDSGTTFIGANTIEMPLEEMNEKHIIPCYARDNEPLISQIQFIEAVQDALRIPFEGETIDAPQIRVSHPVRGRIPEARHKAAKDLLEVEKTIYHERAIFKIDIPSIHTTIDGQDLCLSVGGVKAYNLDSIGKDSRSPQHFTLFCGFKNFICSNMCLWSDGSVLQTTVTSLNELSWKIEKLFMDFKYDRELERLNNWSNIGLSEEQFCQFLGRTRYYNHLSRSRKDEIFPLEITDSQFSAVARGYDSMIQPGQDSYLSLWSFFNLCTSAVKSSYLDSYVDRCVNSHTLASHLENHLIGKEESWFLT